MKYMVSKRFRETVESGSVNLPYGTECESRTGRIYCGGRFLVREKSRKAHTNFARNDDGNGVERAKLTQRIERETGQANAETLRRMEDNSLCQVYRKQEHQDVWLWSHEFYIAPVEELLGIENPIREIVAMPHFKNGGTV